MTALKARCKAVFPFKSSAVGSPNKLFNTLKNLLMSLHHHQIALIMMIYLYNYKIIYFVRDYLNHSIVKGAQFEVYKDDMPSVAMFPLFY